MKVSLGVQRAEAAGQWLGLWAPHPTAKQSNSVLVCFTHWPRDTFHLDCHLKSYETTDLIQHSNFVDEETEVPKRVGDPHAFNTGVLTPGLSVPKTPPHYKWRQQRVENNGKMLLSFHTVLPASFKDQKYP